MFSLRLDSDTARGYFANLILEAYGYARRTDLNAKHIEFGSTSLRSLRKSKIFCQISQLKTEMIHVWMSNLKQKAPT
jgi:hypothetical protein